MYDIIKYYFERGIYTKENELSFVKSNHITQEEYEDIIGYSENSNIDEIFVSDEAMSSLD